MDFTVVGNDFSCLLGTRTVQDMGLLTISEEKFIADVGLRSEEPGDLG